MTQHSRDFIVGLLLQKHMCVRTYVMTASASADLKELTQLQRKFDNTIKALNFCFAE